MSLSLSRFLKVVTEEADRMSDGKLFHAMGPATQNARLPRRRLYEGHGLHELAFGVVCTSV